MGNGGSNSYHVCHFVLVAIFSLGGSMKTKLLIITGLVILVVVVIFAQNVWAASNWSKYCPVQPVVKVFETGFRVDCIVDADQEAPVVAPASGQADIIPTNLPYPLVLPTVVAEPYDPYPVITPNPCITGICQ